MFEVEANIQGFGSQNVLCGGGRYNNLVTNLGGPETPGVGFAIGIERLLTALEFEKIELDINIGIDAYIISMSEKEKIEAFKLLQNLRLNGFNCDMDYMNRNLKSNFKQSERLNAKFVIIIGEDELKNDILTIKNNITKEEYKIDSCYIINFLDEKLGDFDE